MHLEDPTDSGAFNGGSDVEIRPIRTELATFGVVGVKSKKLYIKTCQPTEILLLPITRSQLDLQFQGNFLRQLFFAPELIIKNEKI